MKTRTSFIEVLTSILKQGAEFHSLADTALADRYNQILELVTTDTAEGDFPIMMAIINSVPPEYLVLDLVMLKSSNTFIVSYLGSPREKRVKFWHNYSLFIATLAYQF